MASVTPQHLYASVRQRMLSYCAEVFLLSTAVLLWQGLLFLLGLNPLIRGLQADIEFPKVAYHLWLLGTIDLPLVVYYTGTLASSAQATLVMRWLGLRLESADGGRVRYRQAFLRTIVMLIPFEINHAFLVWASTSQGIPTQLPFQFALVGGLGVVYTLMALRSNQRQSLHDRAAGTVVVKRHSTRRYIS